MGIAQAWTLTVEETFYLLAPAIIMIRSKVQLFLVPVIAVGAGFILVLLSKGSQNFFGDTSYMLTYTFFGRCTEFCAGIFLGMILTKTDNAGFRHFTYSGVVLIAAAIVTMALLRKPESGSLAWSEIAINNLIFPFCVIVFFNGLLRETTLVSKILSTKVFQLLGKSSYAFYLIHVGVIQQFISREITGNRIVLVVVLNLIAIMLWYAIERPLQRILKDPELSPTLHS
jgi:peptidoglycan/LPS O-acetylase OafA/YrhL